MLNIYPLWKWVLHFVFFAGKNAQGGPVPGAQITHAVQCPRSQVSFNLFHKCRSVSLQLWVKELHFRLRHLVAKHQSWVQMHLTAWIKISQFLKQMFPLQSHSANTTALSTSQGHVLLFECRWPWHLSAGIPTAVFKPLKSGLCFCWR